MLSGAVLTRTSYILFSIIEVATKNTIKGTISGGFGDVVRLVGHAFLVPT